jgi:large-conductance mechanosensitive channel
LKERYIPPFIVLLAGAVTSIINIVNKVELVTGLKRLLIVIIIFYFVGLIVKAVIKVAYTKFAKKAEPEAAEEKPEEENQTESKKAEGKQPEDRKS